MCDRHLAAIVCGVTSLLCAAVVVVSSVAHANRPHGAIFRGGALGSDSEALELLDSVLYKGCTDCPEAAFCKYADNPGCGGGANGGVVTFVNKRHSQHCDVQPLLTIPRSYIRDLDDLRSKGGSQDMLRMMLAQGFKEYRGRGYQGVVQQCIHRPKFAQVHWLHLHSFCENSHFDGMPDGGHTSICESMAEEGDAERIAGVWASSQP